MNKWNGDDWLKLPKRGKYTDWKNSIGYKFRGIYKNIEFEVKIIDYIAKGQILIIQCPNKEPFKINAYGFTKCRLGEYLLNRSSHKKKVEDIITTNAGNELIITECFERPNHKGYREKWYKYKCLNCGYLGEMNEGNLRCGNGCACCSTNPKKVVEGINDIATVAPWMIPYFQGGIEQAKQFTKASETRIYPICPDCGRIKDKTMTISNIYYRHSIACSCGDGMNYPEKLMYSVLEQLNIEFITQLNKTILKWCEGYKYDFYIPSMNMIIETHGLQHYEKTNRWRGLEFEIKNDRVKKELALANEIKEEDYIVINCKYSDLEWIKNSILDSKLNNIFDLSRIDWLKCEEFTMKNLAKEVCIYRNNNNDLSANKISKHFKIGLTRTLTYLKRGTDIGWCYYNANEENIKSALTTGKLNSKCVEIFKDNISLGIFESCHELERQSEKLFGVKLGNSSIARVSLGKIKQYKGYTFSYINKEELLNV